MHQTHGRGDKDMTDKPDHRLGRTSTDIPYKYGLLRAGDEWLRKGKVDPATTRSEVEERQRQASDRRILAGRQRRRQKRQREAMANQERFQC
jgi:hypothetical protein